VFVLCTELVLLIRGAAVLACMVQNDSRTQKSCFIPLFVVVRTELKVNNDDDG